jgi:hypothetical protein
VAVSPPRYSLARACVAPDEAFETLDAMAARVLALIGRATLVTLRDANLGRSDPALPHGPCVSIRIGGAPGGDLVAYALFTPPGRDDRTRLMKAMARAEADLPQPTGA